MQRGTLLVATLMTCLAFAGCLNNDAPIDDGGAAAMDPHAPLASYLHDLSEPMDGVATITEQYRTSAPGPLGEPGIELDTWIIRPDIDEDVPVVLEITPYYGGGEPTGLGAVGRELISRGYAVGVSSVRGTGNSGGCFSQGGSEEALDSSAVIEQLAAQDWANGNVGLIGVSYPGTTPQDVWVAAPPSLKAIVPISGISDLYKYNFVNGVHINPQGPAFNLYYWLLVGASPAGLSGGAQVLDPAHMATAAAGEACAEQVNVQAGGGTSAADANKDAYWQERDFLAELQADDRDIERAAVFYVHGLQDWNVKPHNMEDWIDGLWDSEVPMKVWLGQWAHAWPAPSGADATCDYNTDQNRGGSCRADWWNQTLVAWFDQWLKEKDTGIMDAPRVQVQDDDGVWRHEDQWPPLDVRWDTFYVGQDELSMTTPGAGLATYSILPAGESLPAAGPTSSRADGFTVVSQPFTRDTTVSGLPRFEASVMASGNRANLVFSIGEENEAGIVRWINHGALSLNHAEDLANGATSIASVWQDIAVDLFPQDDIIHAGHKLVLSFGGNIAGGPGPSFAPVNDPGEIVIDLSTATLWLPVDESRNVERDQPYSNWDSIQ